MLAMRGRSIASESLVNPINQWKIEIPQKINVTVPFVEEFMQEVREFEEGCCSAGEAPVS